MLERGHSHMWRFLSILTVAPIALAGCEKPDPEQVEFDKPAPTAAVRMMPGDEGTMIVIVQRAHQAFVAAGLYQLQARVPPPAPALGAVGVFHRTKHQN